MKRLSETPTAPWPLVTALGLTLLCQASIAGPVAPETVSGTNPEPSAALRLADGTWSLLPAPADASSSLGEVTSAWIWSLSRPPVRSDGESWRRELASFADHAADTTERLTVRLPQSCGRHCADLEVVAAPLRMWQEVAEAWLPRWPMPENGRLTVPRASGETWRVRLLGDGRAGWWQDIATGDREVIVSPVPATGLRLDVQDALGRPLDNFSLTLLEVAHDDRPPSVLAQYRSSDGRPLTATLPVDGRLSFLVGAPGHVAWSLVGRTADLPSNVRLPAEARVAGRFIDEDGEPLSDVEVLAEAWASRDLALTAVERTVSDKAGRWSLRALPAGEIRLQASGEGLRTRNWSVQLTAGESLGLGDVNLEAGIALRLAIRDAAGAPVVGAAVAVGASRPRWSGNDGIVVVEGQSALAVAEVRVRAEGFLPDEVRLAPPWPDPTIVTLDRGFTVTGLHLTADRLPVTGGSVRIERGNSFNHEDLDTGGRFELLLEPGHRYTLVFSSATTRETRVDLQTGAAGEQQDLGEVVAPPGLTVVGRLLAGDDGTPVAGAHLWTPRARREGLVAAWAFGDTSATESEADGTFLLSGLELSPHTLVVEAPGFARRYLSVGPDDKDSSVDVGDVELDHGATVEVVVRGLDETDDVPLQARLDLRGDWRDHDMLLAPVVDGAAEFVHVPAGESRLTVLVEGEIVCERAVEVDPADERLSLDCDVRETTVEGVVVVADRPAGAGTLYWNPRNAGGTGAVIFNQLSPLGLRRQNTVGRGRPAVTVSVDDDGRFRSTRLGSGRWLVVWQPSSGSATAPLGVDLAAEVGGPLILRFDGEELSGWVRDEFGEPVTGARVRDLETGGTVLTDDAGSFRMAGIDRSSVQLQARWQDLYSEVVELAIEPGRSPDPVHLSLIAGSGNRVPVEVWNANAPAQGAFVFLEDDHGHLQVTTADRDGRCEVVLPAPYPERIRLAAFAEGSWVFGRWLELSHATVGVALTTPDGGALELASEEAGGLEIVSPGGWSVSTLLTLLGSRPHLTPAQPLVLAGLPPGVYQLRLGDLQRTASVDEGRRREVSFE